MGFMNERYIGMNVVIELKNGSKYFGVIEELDNSNENIIWVILKTDRGKQIIAEGEISRMEVVE